MSLPQIEIQIIASLVAMACAIPGVFLVLRKMALISDAISHSILPGIVIGFFLTQNLNSPLLILFAAFTGVLTVILVEYFQKTGLVKEDTAIGLVFPILFSIGIIMISKNASDIHLDIDAVLLGELAFAPFDRLEIGENDLGPVSMWVMGGVLILNLSLLILFFKELKVTTFDAGLASAMGISPVILHYGLMSVSSVTIVGAFDAVGAILVIALIIAPAATAYLLTNDLKKMIGLSLFFGVFSAIAGYWVAHLLDASIAGSIATTLGLVFLMVYFFAPEKGVLSVYFRQKRQRLEVSLISFLLHISQHEEKNERHIHHLQEHIAWDKEHAQKILNLALKNDFIQVDHEIISLTEKGKSFTGKAMEYITEDRQERIEFFKEDFFLLREYGRISRKE